MTDRRNDIAQSITDEVSKAWRSPTSRRHWRPPTRTARNASPSPSPTRTRGPARSPPSRGYWRPPTRTAPPGSAPIARNASPSPSPTNPGRPGRSPTSRGHWRPPTRTARNASPSPSPTRPEGQALADIARALAATDPDRAARLIADAERIAQSITDKDWEGQRARRHREGTGGHRPGPRGTHRPVHHRRDPKAARSPTSRGHWRPPTRTARNASPSPSPTKYWKASALADIARALAATDPDRAAGSSPTRNASPSPSPTKTRRPARSPTSPGHWRPPTRTARNASPSPSPTKISARPARSPTSPGHWQPPTRTARNASPSPSPTKLLKVRYWVAIAEASPKDS